MARNLDLPKLISAADRRDFSAYTRLSNIEKKEFVYGVVLQWVNTITGSQLDNELYLRRVNDRMNQYGDLLWKHPDLAYALLASCGSGRALKHVYTKGIARTAQDTTLIDFLAIHWPGLNQDEANIILSKMDKAAFMQLLRETGLESEQEKKIVAAYGKSDRKN